MTDMNAVMLSEWGGELAVENVPVPEPKPNEVRIAVHACGVTRTVENAINGGLDDDPSLTPRIPGHEFAGVVDALGENVSDRSVGEHVLAYFYLICGECNACQRGKENRCTNFDGWIGINSDGAYAEYATIPVENTLPIPRTMSFPAAAIAADGLATPLHVCERADVSDDDTVLVIGGAGRIGVHLCQLAAARGAHVIAADVRTDRLTHIDEATGSMVTPVDASEPDFTAQLREATSDGSGPNVVVDTVGDIDTLTASWDTLTMGGQVVTLTTHHERSFAPLLKDFVIKEASVLGSRYAARDEVIRAAGLFDDGQIDPIVTNTIGLDEVPSIHADIRTGESYGMTVVEPKR